MSYHQFEAPESTIEKLPRTAQEIFKEAYSAAWDKYRLRRNRRNDVSREEVAQRFAWTAVQQKYEKTAQGWMAIN